MKIVIEGESKEIAALVLELQGRLAADMDTTGADIARKIVESINHQTESGRIFR